MMFNCPLQYVYTIHVTSWRHPWLIMTYYDPNPGHRDLYMIKLELGLCDLICKSDVEFDAMW